MATCFLAIIATLPNNFPCSTFGKVRGFAGEEVRWLATVIAEGREPIAWESVGRGGGARSALQLTQLGKGQVVEVALFVGEQQRTLIKPADGLGLTGHDRLPERGMRKPVVRSGLGRKNPNGAQGEDGQPIPIRRHGRVGHHIAGLKSDHGDEGVGSILRLTFQAAQNRVGIGAMFGQCI